MSIEFSGSTQRFSIDSGSDIDCESFTVCGKFKLTSSADCVLLTFYTGTGSRVHTLYYDSTTGSLYVRENYTTVVAEIGAVTTGEWFTAGIRGTSYTDGKIRLNGFVKRPSGGFISANADSGQYVDTLNHVYIGTSKEYTALWLRGRAADIHIWKSYLSDSDLTTQSAQQAAVTTTALVCSNYCDGGDLANASSSNVDNSSGAYAATWGRTDYDGTTPGTPDPAYSADAPTYAGTAPTLSGTVAMPSTLPSLGVDVATLRANTVSDGTSVTVTYATPPASDRLLVACVGGYTPGTTVTISDAYGATWTQVDLERGSGAAADIVAGAWYAQMPSGGGVFTVTATANSGSYLTLAVLEVVKHYAASPLEVVGTATRTTGSSIAPTAPTTVTPKTLLIGVSSWVSALTEVSSVGGSYTETYTKPGQAGLSVVKRYVTAAGTYSPTVTLSQSDAHVGFVFALTEQGQLLTGGPPPVIRGRRRRR